MCESPISPSISAFGVSAATESMTTTSTRARAHQHVGDFQRLLAGIRLRHQQIIDIHAELPGVHQVERMLGVDEGRGAAQFLALRDNTAGPGSSCPRIPARKSRPPGRAASRRCRGQYPAPANRWKRPRPARTNAAVAQAHDRCPCRTAFRSVPVPRQVPFACCRPLIPTPICCGLPNYHTDQREHKENILIYPAL